MSKPTKVREEDLLNLEELEEAVSGFDPYEIANEACEKLSKRMTKKYKGRWVNVERPEFEEDDGTYYTQIIKYEYSYQHTGYARIIYCTDGHVYEVAEGTWLGPS